MAFIPFGNSYGGGSRTDDTWKLQAGQNVAKGDALTINTKTGYLIQAAVPATLAGKRISIAPYAVDNSSGSTAADINVYNDAAMEFTVDCNTNTAQTQVGQIYNLSDTNTVDNSAVNANGVVFMRKILGTPGQKKAIVSINPQVLPE